MGPNTGKASEVGRLLPDPQQLALTTAWALFIIKWRSSAISS